MIESLENNPSIIVAAHRGYKSAFPENTLIAFQKALDLGAQMLEFDLRLSKDKVPMVMHDETIDRTTNGTGKISDYTMAELKKFKTGAERGNLSEHEIPTFEELCELLVAYPNILLNVEIKPSPDAREVAESAIQILRKYNYLARCVFTSFDAKIIAYVHDTYQLKTQGFPKESMLDFDSSDDGTYSKMWAVGLSMKQLSHERVKEFQNMGILVWGYCPDKDEQVIYALECGATLLTCNNPEPALRLRDNFCK